MERYVCIHGHFYQPPRENAWLESIELQDPAYPYHDWNERITAECYAPNANARILDREGRIVGIENNYSRISFNIGPTLLSWMQAKAGDVYEAILEADRKSQSRFGGHGSAIAQVYNHMILPLANRRDKYSQVLWGIRDFEHRFRRPPEGMWLSETAVDLESLDIMAELGIRFTVLSPLQAARVRRIGEPRWHDVRGGRIDPSRAYSASLLSGRKIALYFYDGPISHAVAFEGLLSSGAHFAERLLGGLSDRRGWPQIAHIATDGESYGHHHRHGEMALAFVLAAIESNKSVRLTNYAEYLARHPPDHEVELIEQSSWSCTHGVDRWRRDCGCNSGRHPGYHQAWREPLRMALDWLRDELAPRFESRAGELLKDPWAARDAYIAVILDRSERAVADFLGKTAKRNLDEAERTIVLKLMELQRQAMLMYTSCGWFFDDVAGIETVQIMQYAARAIQLAGELFDQDIEPGFLERLAKAPSNDPAFADGRRVYEQLVKPAKVDLSRVGVHYAINSMFEEYPPKADIGSYLVERERGDTFESEDVRFRIGHAWVRSEITHERQQLSYAAADMGDLTLIGGVRPFESPEAHAALVGEVADLFKRTDYPGLNRFMDRRFFAGDYSIQSLFRDELRRILNLILKARLAEVEVELRQLYQHHTPLLAFLSDLRAPLPRAFLSAVEFVLNVDLRRNFESRQLDLDRAQALLKQVGRWPGVELDKAGLAYALQRAIRQFLESLAARPEDAGRIAQLEAVVAYAQSTLFPVDFSETQNLCFKLIQAVRPEQERKAQEGDVAATEWMRRFDALAEKLQFRLP